MSASFKIFGRDRFHLVHLRPTDFTGDDFDPANIIKQNFQKLSDNGLQRIPFSSIRLQRNDDGTSSHDK